MSKYLAGIDYSITGPAACVHPIESEWSINNCRFLSFDGVKKNAGYWNNETILIEPHIKSYEYDVDRYSQMADKFVSFLKCYGVDDVCIEGYAYQACGKVFSLAEATGILKYKMTKEYQMKLSAQTPPVFKKFATDKGNANKQKMYDAFIEDTGLDLIKLFNHNKLRAPVDNLVDSYWICKYHYDYGYSRIINNQ